LKYALTTLKEASALKRGIIFLLIVTLALGLGPALAPARATADSGSYVIGRITGTYQELPGYFQGNEHLYSQGIDKVEFTGFHLRRVTDGKSFYIRPNLDGYFYQALPGGRYALMRKRNDRPDYREPKSIDLVELEVGQGTLVNLGTIRLILDQKPRESLRLYGDSAKGTYTYRYHYERESGDKAYSMPLDWFTGRKPDVRTGFGDRIVQDDTQLTREHDGTRVTFREGFPLMTW